MAIDIKTYFSLYSPPPTPPMPSSAMMSVLTYVTNLRAIVQARLLGIGEKATDPLATVPGLDRLQVHIAAQLAELDAIRAEFG